MRVPPAARAAATHAAPSARKAGATLATVVSGAGGSAVTNVGTARRGPVIPAPNGEKGTFRRA